jgi:transcription termination factor NusB
MAQMDGVDNAGNAFSEANGRGVEQFAAAPLNINESQIDPFLRLGTQRIIGEYASKAISAALQINPNLLQELSSPERAELLDETAQAFTRQALTFLNPNVIRSLGLMFDRELDQELIRQKLAEYGITEGRLKENYALFKSINKNEDPNATNNLGMQGELVTAEGIRLGTNDLDSTKGFLNQMAANGMTSRLAELPSKLSVENVFNLINKGREFMKSPEGLGLTAISLILAEFIPDILTYEEVFRHTVTQDYFLEQRLFNGSMEFVEIFAFQIAYKAFMNMWKAEKGRHTEAFQKNLIPFVVSGGIYAGTSIYTFAYSLNFIEQFYSPVAGHAIQNVGVGQEFLTALAWLFALSISFGGDNVLAHARGAFAERKKKNDVADFKKKFTTQIVGLAALFSPNANSASDAPSETPPEYYIEEIMSLVRKNKKLAQEILDKLPTHQSQSIQKVAEALRAAGCYEILKEEDLNL